MEISEKQHVESVGLVIEKWRKRVESLESKLAAYADVVKKAEEALVLADKTFYKYESMAGARAKTNVAIQGAIEAIKELGLE